jgi:hypothetical protein
MWEQVKTLAVAMRTKATVLQIEANQGPITVTVLGVHQLGRDVATNRRTQRSNGNDLLGGECS